MSTLPTKDLVIEIQSRSGESGGYAVKLWTSDSEILKSTTKLRGEIANRKLEDIWKPVTALRRSPNDYVIKEVGQFLFEFLPGSISDLVEHEYRLAKENQQILRLKIVSKDPGAVDLPWELLYIPSHREFLTLHPNASIIRYVPASVSSPPSVLESSLRILFVLTNPKDERLMIANEELDAIKGNLDNINSFQTEILWEPTLEAFAKKLVAFQPHVVHYIGHGGIGRGEGNLILHDNLDRSYWLTPIQLSTILPPTVHLLCLSTCFTVENYQIQAFNLIGQTWGQHDLPSMVVNQFSLSREGVNVFWRIFYGTLRDMGELNTAVSRARLAVYSAVPSAVDWASFVLHLRTPSDKLFSEAPVQITSRSTLHSAELATKTHQMKALEIQINSLTEILNDLKVQVSSFENPPIGLQNVIEKTENHHYDLLGKLTNLKDSLVSSDVTSNNAGN